MTLLKWFDGYINKPVTLQRLAETAAGVLSHAEAELIENTGNNAARASSAVPELPQGLLVLPDLIPPEVYRKENTQALFSRDKAPSEQAEGPLILVVEDHEVNRQLFALTLAKLGCRTLLAEDGIAGLEKARADPPDLIFMDIQMPRMNGYEAAEELRKTGYDKPIIAVTASAQTDEKLRCVQAGFNDILLKPFMRPEMEAILVKWTGGTGIAGGAGGALADKTRNDKEADRGNEIFTPRDLLETFMDNTETAKSLLGHFVQRSAEQIDSLPALAEAENWQEARRIAHTIKGSSLTLSGKELGKCAGRLELAYKNIDHPEMEAAIGPFKEAFARFKNAVEAYLNEK
jgi:CheY-like chemotaxis protein